jgi:hypothetical protein
VCTLLLVRRQLSMHRKRDESGFRRDLDYSVNITSVGRRDPVELPVLLKNSTIVDVYERALSGPIKLFVDKRIDIAI